MNRKLFTIHQIRQAFDIVDGKCENCGRDLSWSGWNAHHKKPRSVLTKAEIDKLGDGAGLGNIAILCNQCHRDVHDGRLDGFTIRRWEEIPSEKIRQD